MSGPAPGSILSGVSTTLHWTTGSGATGYYLSLDRHCAGRPRPGQPRPVHHLQHDREPARRRSHNLRPPLVDGQRQSLALQRLLLYRGREPNNYNFEHANSIDNPTGSLDHILGLLDWNWSAPACWFRKAGSLFQFEVSIRIVKTTPAFGPASSDDNFRARTMSP
jgi:hypothetical protein